MLRHFLGTAAGVMLFIVAVAASAMAQSHVALVIGNSAYQAAPSLATTAADAETLRGAGYDVTELHDVRQADIGQTMRDFIDKAAAAGPNGVAFFYFAGHAAQVPGKRPDGLCRGANGPCLLPDAHGAGADRARVHAHRVCIHRTRHCSVQAIFRRTMDDR